MHDLAPTTSPGPPDPARFDLLGAALAGRCERTARAYRTDYEDFARFMGAGSPGAALDQLVAHGAGAANAMALGYRADLLGRGLAASTIARRLAALRSAAKIARMLGRIAWSLEVESPRVESYRDTAGPGRDGWARLLGRAEAEASTPRGRRDLALIRLMHDLALRRGEAVGLDLADLDLERGVVMVRGKGKTGKVPITLPAPTRAALADWLTSRGEAPGPLFTRLDRADAGGRLTGRSVHRLVSALGRRTSLSRPLRPHGLRHEAITHALDATGGDVRAVRRFSRHSKVETLMVYDDNREDLAGDVARVVAGG